ncbi:hypothetical protein BDP67DRAFT_515516 [Colletotrichum lupini]|nr:hypothetical protein BDP67DRAFT_515516 [Colletotrichum lupini]
MSGIEAVGLVLGLWPIIANLVKGYNAAKDGDDRELFLLKLDVQQIIYERCARQLVQQNEEGIGDNLNNMEIRLLGTSSWQNLSFRTRLRKRLGTRELELLESVLKQIEKTMISLRSQLESGQADLTIPGTRRSRMKHHFRQMRINMPHSEFQKSFEKLKEHNKDLQQLVQAFEQPRITIEQKSWTSGRTRQILNMTRPRCVLPTHINEFSRILEDSYRCKCSRGHGVDLNINGDTNYQVYFHVGDEIEGQSDRKEQNIAPGTPQQTDFSRTPSQDNIKTPWSRSSQKSKSSEYHRKRITRTLPIMFYRPLSESKDYVIGDMCKLVKSLHGNVGNTRRSYQTIGTLGYGDRHFAARLMEPGVPDDQVISLDEKLPETEDWLLSRQSRHDIAQRLALAIVQFWSTSWIERWWTWKNFSIKEHGPRDLEIFVTRTILAPNCRGKATEKPAVIWKSLREPLLIRLGFALIELAMGMRLSRLRTKEMYSSVVVEDIGEISEDAKDYDTAMTILEQKVLQDEVSLAYQTVVEACLRCEVVRETGAISLTTTASSFQEDVEREILQPLAKHYHTTWGGR